MSIKRLTTYFVQVTLAFFLASPLLSQEICNNGIDDDADGLIDLNDSDCNCASSNLVWNPTSLLVNGDFENFTGCPPPQGFGNVCPGWYDINTSDYYNTSCVPTSYFQPDTGSMSGVGCAGFYDNYLYHPTPALRDDFKEYIGTCLAQPLVVGKDYKLTLKFGIGKGYLVNNFVRNNLQGATLGIYGSLNCSDTLPTGFRGCPSNISANFTEIASQNITGSNKWVVVEVLFTANIAANQLYFGSSCSHLNALYQTQYNYIDSLVLLEKFDTNANYAITKNGSYCQNNFSLRASTTNTDTIQWYRNGIALVGQTGNTLTIDTSDHGVYTSVITNNLNNCFRTNDISITSEKKNCEEPLIFVPNTFTPNKDDHNDVFKPSFYGEVTHYQLHIFNRWGELIFESSDPQKGWDGTHQTKAVPNGVYVWKIRYQALDETKALLGHVQVLK